MQFTNSQTHGQLYGSKLPPLQLCLKMAYQQSKLLALVTVADSDLRTTNQ